MEFDVKELGIEYFKGRKYVENFMLHILLVIDKGEYIENEKIENAILDGDIVSLICDKEGLSDYHTEYLQYDKLYINALFKYVGMFNTDYKKLYDNGYVMLIALCKEILEEPNTYITDTTE